MKETFGLIRGTRVYVDTVRSRGAEIEGPKRFFYYALSTVIYPVVAILGTGEHILHRLKDGGLERK